jgi:hypothetical protein
MYKKSPKTKQTLTKSVLCLLCLFVAVIGQTPKETLFRPGSISKLFTWTAIIQL